MDEPSATAPAPEATLPAAQIKFGTRKMWARGIDGGTVAEKGARLVYSLSPVDGLIIAVLYPATLEA